MSVVGSIQAEPSSEEEYEQYYQRMLVEGQQYQDFVAHELYERGLPLVMFQTKKYQYLYGENRAGVEIKFDKQMKRNCYIEIAERAGLSRPAYTKSGIYRDDNTWIYASGNYERLFLFSRNWLVRVHKSGKCRVVTNKYDTSKGFLLPVSLAEFHAARVVSFKGASIE